MTSRFCMLLSFLCFSLSSCMWSDPISTKRAACNELKGRLIFNGSTGITRTAEMETAEKLLDQHTYEVNDCDWEFMSP